MTALNISYLIISPHLLNRRNWGNLLLFFRNKGHVSVYKNTQGKNKERAASRGLLFTPPHAAVPQPLFFCVETKQPRCSSSRVVLFSLWSNILVCGQPALHSLQTANLISFFLTT